MSVESKVETVTVDFLNMDNKSLRLEVRVSEAAASHIVIKQGGQVVMPIIKKDAGDLVALTFDFSYKHDVSVSFMHVKTNELARVRFGRFCQLHNNGSWSYAVIGNNILTAHKNMIRIEKYSKQKHTLYELRLLCMMPLHPKLRSTLREFKKRQGLHKYIALLIPAKSVLSGFVNAFLRLTYHILRRFKLEHVWIVSDRGDAAGDNGEVLFRALQKSKPQNTKVYFALLGNSRDLERMQQYGPVLKFGTLRYKVMFIMSEAIISSQASEYIINPFGDRYRDFANILKYKFIFLQHGVIYNDLSRFLSKYKKNIAMFVTSAVKEYESILSYPYYYDESVVKITGLPRYDLLVDKSTKRNIMVAPTWRTNIAGPLTRKAGVREYNPEFVQSQFYKFYQGLLTNKRLVQLCEDQGITVDFYLHPSLNAQISDFKNSGTVRVVNPPYNYSEAFQKASLLITDYSSIQFDMAYMMKPIIYTQFDHDTFYEGQLYDKGYFETEADGFGTVVTSIEQTVDQIEKLINNDFKLSKKYEARVRKFFKYSDRKNVDRVIRETLNTLSRNDDYEG